MLSSLWQCEAPNQHFANIALDAKDRISADSSTQKIHFELAWSCPAQTIPVGQREKSLWLSIETFPEDQTMTRNPSETLQQSLETALDMCQKSKPCSNKHAEPDGAAASPLPDLRTVPDLCRHLLEQSSGPVSIACAGFLQRTKTFKHLIYADRDRTVQRDDVKSLEDALNAAKSDPEGIPYPEKLTLAKLLALAVLRYHSTPWLNSEWGSRDIVFFGIKDFSQDPLNGPFLRSRVATKTSTFKQHSVTQDIDIQTTVAHLRSPIRNQTLYSLGVMLVELAYDSPLQDLQKPEDDQGDPHTLYWTATRLGDKVGRKLGPKYADAVKICLYGGFGASSELEDAKVQKQFFDEVVRKLAKCAEAVMI